MKCSCGDNDIYVLVRRKGDAGEGQPMCGSCFNAFQWGAELGEDGYEAEDAPQMCSYCHEMFPPDDLIEDGFFDICHECHEQFFGQREAS